MNNEINIDILIKYLSGRLDPSEAEQVSRWIEASDENHDSFQALKQAWEQQDLPSHEFSSEEIERSWQTVRGETIVKTDNPTADVSPGKHITIFPLLRKIAAVLIVGLAVGYGVKTYIDVQKQPEHLVQTNETGKREVLLADGTKVWLNKLSSLGYDDNVNTAERVVYLKGEAYFEVAKDPERPFIIHSGDMAVQVLGTSFNVDNRTTEGKQLVTVTSGKVAVYDQNDAVNRVELIKGEVAEFEKTAKRITKSDNQNLNFLAWKTGELTFKNSSLQSTLFTLADHFDVRFELPTEISDGYRFNASFDNQPLEEILLVMEISLGLQFESREDHIAVSRK
ncbi:FecR domain-containing protein [Fulvivirgaceae bacterium BMA12]|uniref:FecR domain-containing protein n=1 Tax=Agaribacillus aureus TaxID=3051825 RepID=A0ABT8L0X2_9BACT|nr:FecR domain-containing protein [Fulvivirgaceae bacterium BMA12]